MLKKIRDLLKQEKRVLVIMQGVPGSGKSTAARELHDEFNGTNLADGLPGYEPSYCDPDAVYPIVNICSTDDINERLNGGKYIFEPAFLGRYHGINQSQAHQCMKARVNLVIIDNTNIKRRDYRNYLEYANLYGYEVVYYKVGETNFEGANSTLAELYAERNTHGVPLEVILRMGRQFQPGVNHDG
jgi:predicted kinase